MMFVPRRKVKTTKTIFGVQKLADIVNNALWIEFVLLFFMLKQQQYTLKQVKHVTRITEDSFKESEAPYPEHKLKKWVLLNISAIPDVSDSDFC